MTAKKIEIRELRDFEVNPSTHMVKLDGNLYSLYREKIGRDGHIKTLLFQEVDPNTLYKRKQRLAKKLIKDSGMTAEDIIINALGYVNLLTMDKIEKELLKKKAIAKPGCLSIKVGRYEVPIIE